MIKHGLKEIPVFPPLPATWSNCKDPVQAIHDAQIAAFDPTGSRTRLFSRDNPESAKVGDILLVRQKNGDPYAGVCLNIRKRGIDTSILLRNQMTRVGVEMWYKVYSPNVTGIEVVQRKDKRARRNKLYYMRYVCRDTALLARNAMVCLAQWLSSTDLRQKTGARYWICGEYGPPIPPSTCYAGSITHEGTGQRAIRQKEAEEQQQEIQGPEIEMARICPLGLWVVGTICSIRHVTWMIVYQMYVT